MDKAAVRGTLNNHPENHVFQGPLYVHPAQPSKGSYLLQAQRERACIERGGHWWQPTGMIDWFCCACGAEEEGMPQDGTGNRRFFAVTIANIIDRIYRRHR